MKSSAPLPNGDDLQRRVRNVTKLLSLFVIAFMATAACAQGNSASGRASAETTVKGTKITITYGRPELKGRDLTKEAPVGTVWRLGRNEATEITTSGALDVAGTKVAAGKYSLWAKKVSDTEWHLCFHPKTCIWGAPPQTEGYVAELPLKGSTGTDSVELLTIGLAEAGGKAQVTISWGTTRLTGDIGVG
jgi:hypothetical protein